MHHFVPLCFVDCHRDIYRRWTVIRIESFEMCSNACLGHSICCGGHWLTQGLRRLHFPLRRLTRRTTRCGRWALRLARTLKACSDRNLSDKVDLIPAGVSGRNVRVGHTNPLRINNSSDPLGLWNQAKNDAFFETSVGRRICPRQPVTPRSLSLNGRRYRAAGYKPAARNRISENAAGKSTANIARLTTVSLPRLCQHSHTVSLLSLCFLLGPGGAQASLS